MLRIETELPNHYCNVIESLDELPEVPDCRFFTADFETTLYDKERLKVCHRKARNNGAFFPYNGDRICGIAITYENEKEAYYVPIRHKLKGKNNPGNLDLDKVIDWLKQHSKIPYWLNANPKFDAHFANVDGFDYRGELIDVLADAKVYDVEYPTHKLKTLLRRWLNLPMSDLDKIKVWLKEEKTGDYAELPIDLAGEYATMDVFGARLLYAWLKKNKREGTEKVLDIEHRLTGVLYDMEKIGLKSDRTMILKEMKVSLSRMIEAASALAELTGKEYSDSSKHNYSILCVDLGLPILAWTEKKDKATGEKRRGGPSFDKDALVLYEQHPQVKLNEKAKKIIENIRVFREESNFKSLFLEPYLKFMDEDGFIHPSFNQIVRTGRMSCGTPNFQQLNSRAKNLIIPEEGYGFLSFDASQIEFRIIVHYIQDPEALKAYKENRNADFHTIVAESVTLEWNGFKYVATRKQGKTLNFSMAFGSGEKKVTAQLAGDDALISFIAEIADSLISEGKLQEEKRKEFIIQECYKLGKQIYYKYHEMFPGMKRVSKAAENSTRNKRYAVNLYGRRRYLSRKRAHIAFNTAVQGSAMDAAKEAMIRLAPRNNIRMRQWGIHLVCSVHDEILFYGKISRLKDPEVINYIWDILENPSIPLRVPILWDGGFSDRNWKEAAGDDQRFNEGGNWVAGRFPEEFRKRPEVPNFDPGCNLSYFNELQPS